MDIGLIVEFVKFMLVTLLIVGGGLGVAWVVMSPYKTYEGATIRSTLNTWGLDWCERPELGSKLSEELIRRAYATRRFTFKGLMGIDSVNDRATVPSLAKVEFKLLVEAGVFKGTHCYHGFQEVYVLNTERLDYRRRDNRPLSVSNYALRPRF